MKLLYNLFFFSPEPILVIVRLAENGCLLSHLRKNRERQYINFKAESAVHFTPVDKITIARDVANGMLHLSNKKVKKIYIFLYFTFPLTPIFMQTLHDFASVIIIIIIIIIYNGHH